MVEKNYYEIHLRISLVIATSLLYMGYVSFQVALKSKLWEQKHNCIMSQSYNATVFYFVNISFSRACIKQIISPKRKFNQSSILPNNGFNNLLPTVQETNHFMEVGWLKNK